MSSPTITKSTSLGEGRKIVYSVQEDSSNNTHTLYVTDISGKGIIELTKYQSGYEVGSTIPKVSKTGLVVYLDGRDKLSTVDLKGNKKIIAQSESGNQIRDFIISDDGSIVLYQEVENPEEGGQDCKSSRLWKVDITLTAKEPLYDSKQNYLLPLTITPDKNAIVLGGTFQGGEASCFGPAKTLQKLSLLNKQLTTIKQSQPLSVQLISPDGTKGILAYSTNPASPLISTPSKQYPVRVSLTDLSSGVETTLVESTDRYLFPVGWYSNSQEVLYLEQAPDTVADYQNILDAYKKVGIQTKQVTLLFTLERRGSGMEYNQVVDDNTLIYTIRNNPDWENGTSLYRVSLDGTNKVELDKKVRFMYLVGIF